MDKNSKLKFGTGELRYICEFKKINFKRNGYVVVPNVLNINDIRLIKDISSKFFGRKI